MTNLTQLDRILVIGTSCAGKSTLARRLAGVLGVPHVELDALHWQPNWTETPIDEFRAKVGDALAAPRWVVDGNYSKLGDITRRSATTIIWLNYSFPLVVGRALLRTFKRVVLRETLWAGNRETCRMTFSRESIIWWVLTTHRRRRKQFSAQLQDPAYAHINFIVLKSPREAEKLAREILVRLTTEGTEDYELIA